ncbi:cytochrome P450 [Phaeacidiphilus oryzae]|uniref:cytochrome P450 n=1 Tax=Phaeacidiphilus oryzae TaxID=348818 RepID=UPI00068E90BA|nr:cytochrome P450 [Phaeacidiphilus oryzae]
MNQTVPASDVDPFAPEVLADPYPMYTSLREAGPLVWLERYGVWASARYATVRAAVLDHDTFSSATGVGLADLSRRQPASDRDAGMAGGDREAGWRTPSLLLEQDPPDHTRARRVVGSVLSPSAVRAKADAWAAEAETMVRALVGTGEFDAVSRLAQEFPLRLFADAVGLPREGRAEHLLPFADFAFNAFGPPNELFRKSVSSGNTALPWVVRHCYPDRLDPDGWGARIHALALREGYSRDEGAVLVRSLLAAGIDTTVRSLGTVLWLLATHPEQYAELRARPELIRPAFDEAVRLESPTRMFFRSVTADTVLDGVELPAGSRLLLLFGAANRDPRRWDRPEEFDITRRSGGHLGFGVGIHACVGRIVAYLEAEVMLRALIRWAPVLRAGGPPRWHLNNTIRGLAELPLTLASGEETGGSRPNGGDDGPH